MSTTNFYFIFYYQVRSCARGAPLQSRPTQPQYHPSTTWSAVTCCAAPAWRKNQRPAAFCVQRAKARPHAVMSCVYITDRWQKERRASEAKMDLLQRFQERTLTCWSLARCGIHSFLTVTRHTVFLYLVDYIPPAAEVNYFKTVSKLVPFLCIISHRLLVNYIS